MITLKKRLTSTRQKSRIRICNYCEKYILKNERLNLGYKINAPLIVSRIQYRGFYWDVPTNIPLNYCPNCGVKMELYNGKN